MNNDPRGGWTSASAASADSACAGRHCAQRGLADVKGEFSESGDRLHAALYSSYSGLLKDLKERDTFDACQSIEAKIVSQYFGHGVDAKVFREKRFWIEFDGSGLKHSGQVDACHRAAMKALVIDYKSLLGEVPESPKNMQLRDLAVLVRHNLVFVDEIAVAVIQPWVTHSPEICLYTKADLILAEAQLHDRVKASNDPNSPRTPSELACKYCLAARHGKCLEYQRWAGQVTPPALLNVLEVPVASWTPEQRSTAMNALKPAYALLDSIEGHIRQGLEKDPGFCPGWHLAPGQKRESINNPQLVYERFIALGGKHEAFMNAVNVLKGELRQALNDATGAKGMMLDRAIKTLTEGCVVVNETRPSLKRKEKE